MYKKLFNSLRFIGILALSFEAPSPLNASPSEAAAAATDEPAASSSSSAATSGTDGAAAEIPSNVSILLTDGKDFLTVQMSNKRAWYPEEAKLEPRGNVATVFEVIDALVYGKNAKETRQCTTFHARMKDVSPKKCRDWRLPSGGTMGGESLIDGAKREFLEETSIDLDHLGATYKESETLLKTASKHIVHYVTAHINTKRLSDAFDFLNKRLEGSHDLKSRLQFALDPEHLPHRTDLPVKLRNLYKGSKFSKNGFATYINQPSAESVVKITWDEFCRTCNWNSTIPLPVPEDELMRCKLDRLDTIEWVTMYEFSDYTRAIIPAAVLELEKTEEAASKRARPAATR